MSLACRFYNHRYPKLDDVVMVNVRSIAELGAYVSLLEYDDTEGMIMLSELSRRRIRSINKLVRIGLNECAVVIRVDEEKGEFTGRVSTRTSYIHAGFFLGGLRGGISPPPPPENGLAPPEL